MTGQLPSVIIPLYVYPLPSAWDALFSVLSDFPNQPITIIINPNSGPFHPYLYKHYFPAIRQLRQFSQVTLIGYIATQYLNKPIEQVIKEIDEYANWENDVSMDGIFFDECTYLPTDLPSYTQYSKHVKSLTWHRENQAGEVIMNPGCVPDTGYYAISDTVVILENTYLETSKLMEDMIRHHVRMMKQEIGVQVTQKMAVMVYSCDTAQAEKVIGWVRELNWQGFFVTSVDGYTAFGDGLRHSLVFNATTASQSS